MALAVGTRLGPYEIVAPLGTGGMGEVYRARDARLDRVVAIKVLPRDSRHPDALERLRREGRAVARLSHPHICALHDIGEHDGIDFLVMEYLEGETLAERLASGPLPLEQALQHALEIVAALVEAHRQGVVHRDLKPANIMLTRAGMKVLDFGLAKLREPDSNERSEAPTRSFDLTAEGTLLGTVPYMAPEQLEGRPVDARTDIFAFGVTVYEMVTGTRPFRGTSRAGLIAAIMASEPQPLLTLRPLAPPLLDRAVQRCLAKDPDQRWQTAQDLAAELSFISESARRPEDRSASTREHVAGRRRPLRAPALVLGAAVALALAAAGWLRLRDSRSAIDSLAVLPFENASADPEAEYLGDGLTESLIEQMSRVPTLKVMARATVFRYKGTADPPEVGRKLGVGAILAGTVSRQGDQLKVSAELVEIATGARLWGEQYEVPIANLIRVQDRLASEISDRLRLRLSAAEKATLARHGTEDPDAYELYLKAGYFLARNNEEDDLEARRLYLRALEKDPKFVDARLGVASTYARSAGSGYAPPAEAWARAEEEYKKALDLDPSNVRARCGRAARRFVRDWDWAGTEREFRELSADPRIVLGPQFHPIAMFFLARGRPEEAVALVEEALRVDPENLESRILMADYLAQAGRLEEAIGHYRRIANDEPAHASPLFGLAQVLKRRGDLTGAIGALRKAYALSGEKEGTEALAAARTEKDYEDAEVAVARSRIARLQALAEEGYVSPLDFARLYARIGEREKAFASLESALAERSPRLVLLKADRAWDGIRDDARFTAAVRRVGIP